MDDIKKAVDMILSSKKTFILTGAGISTESGIHDFRSNTGYYSKMDPALALSKDVLINNPERFYKEGYVILEDIFDKEPNVGHKIIKKLEDLGLVQGIITQNIDNLHTKAGSTNVYEVHGQTRTVHCMKCHKEYSFSLMKELVNNNEIPPKCPECNGVLRPDVVMFGDMMPIDFLKAENELKNTELLLVIGSSLTVSPVNYLPDMVSKLIIINNTPTPVDRRAQVVFHQSSGKVLKEILNEIERRN